MLPIILLFSSLAVVSAVNIDVDISVNRAGGDDTLHSIFPGITNVTDQAIAEFTEILFKQDITKTELENQVRSWAAKNGVLDAVNAEMAKDEQKTKDLRMNVTRALAEFPAAFAQYNEIEDNKSLTINQATEQTEALLDTMKTPFLKRLINAVSYPEYPEGEEPIFTLNAAKRR